MTPNQNEILALYVFDRDFHYAVDPLLEEEFFDHYLLRTIFCTARKFYAEYGDVPTVEALCTAVLHDHPKIDARELTAFFEVHRIDGVNAATKKFYLDHLLELRRIRVAQEVIKRGIDYVSRGEVDRFVHDVVSSLAFHQEDIRTLVFRRDLERVIASLSQVEEERIATLFPTLDECLGGGFATRELVVVLGGTGVGKTAFLVNLAWSALLQGRKVFYYSFEVSAERVIMRMVSTILGMRFSEIMENPDRAIKRLDTHLMRALFNNFVVIEAPTFSMTTSQLDANIESHALQGTVPDIVFVDYADIMLPQRSYRERWLEIETSYMELRAIAMKRNLVMVTASQINREGADARQIKLEHVKGAYGKTHNADVVISLNRSIEDKFKSNLIRLYINKNRNNIADREILLSVDYETMSFSEVQGQVSSSNALV